MIFYLLDNLKKEWNVKIERINKGSWGKVRAFFDIRTEEGIVVKGFSLVEGINGQFVGFPSKKNEQSGEYMPTVWADEPIRAELLQLATRAYGQDAVDSSVSSSTESKENEMSDTKEDSQAPEQPAKTEEFNEDDIPF